MFDFFPLSPEFKHAGTDGNFTDQRLLHFLHNDYAYEAYVPKSRKEHESRRKEVIRRVMLSAGMLPVLQFPDNPPEVTNGRVYKGVVIFDVSVETLPGLRLTGNLFLPEKAKGPVPGILSPHGHWPHGRVETSEIGGVATRCFNFALLGFAVFAWDMLGYNDNNDLPHRWGKSMLQKGYLHGISPFGLQLANSLRAFRFLADRPEVDAGRIGCTGASGGGSQTWFLALLEERIKVMAPVCMLSSHFQGGCPCEEGPLLRTAGLTSFDVVASLAPRPLLLPSVTGDWTGEFPQYEFPRMKQIYALYHAEDRVENFHYDADHNYNRRTREHVYAWFLRNLMGKKNVPETVKESRIAPPPPELLWHSGKEPAQCTPRKSSAVLKKLQKFYAAPETVSPEEGRRFIHDLIDDGHAFRDVVERTLCPRWNVPGGCAAQRILSRRGTGDYVYGIRCFPMRDAKTFGSGKMNWKTGYLLVTGNLSALPGNSDGKLLAELTKKKIPGMVIELFGSAETAKQLQSPVRNTANDLDAAFNHSLFSLKVQDVLTAVTSLKEHGCQKIVLLSPASQTPCVLAALTQLDDIQGIIDMTGLDESVWLDPAFSQVLIGRIGGLAGLAKLTARPGITFCRPAETWTKVLKANGAKVTQQTFDAAVKSFIK